MNEQPPVRRSDERVDGNAQLRARARAHRRRFARKLGVALRDFDAVTAELLARWALARAKLEVDGAGDDGERWWRGFNAEARALQRLEQRVGALGLDRTGNGRGELDEYLRQNYGDVRAEA